ncbi:MAG: ribosomal protein L13e [Nitrososphaerota archaeon]|nr:ribosomal protein L13e [Candidatus Bathyarchaeota archaeon]MDW8061488.1 ribosomal protein L13e [Nitrososphaerota archaeon]
MVRSLGRGFSLGKLIELGLITDKARRLRIAVDKRRKTMRGS